MKLGIGSYSLAWNIGVPGALPANPLDHFGLLSHAARLGVDRVQFCDNLPLESLSTTELDRLLGLASDHGLVIEPGARGIVPDNLSRLAQIARRSGCGFVRLVIDRGDDRPKPNEAVARLRDLGPAFGDLGVRLAIENHDRIPALVLRHMVEELGLDRFGICLDTANSLGCLEGTEHVVAALAPCTVNLHVKDFAIRRVWHNMGFEVVGTSTGAGMLDVPRLLAQVAPTAESATIEIWVSPVEPGVPPVEAEMKMLEESVPALRRLMVEAGL